LIVLDASVMVAWLLGEPSIARGTELDISLRDEPVIVPSHWPIEISNVLRTHLKAGRLSITDFHSVIDRIELMTIRVEPSVDPDDIRSITLFAVTNELTAYDAAYVQLAAHHGLKLATLDRAMRAAAAKLNIALLPA
jgi:predicted nucleic acid-binding protein